MNFKNIILFLSIFCSFFISFQAVAQDTTTATTVVERKVIVTPAPKSAKCTTISGHWEGDVWFDSQTVCTYENRTEGVAWVQDFWSCTKYDSTTGECKTWEYKPGYWLQTMP